jgi:5-methylcytosine-specific restriction protein A
MSLLNPVIEQHDQDDEKRTWPRPMWHDTQCGFCGNPVALNDNLVFVADSPSTIFYPMPENVRAFLCHGDCGPGVGYYIDLNSLAEQGEFGCIDRMGVVNAESWRAHLRSKDWFCWDVESAIEKAHALAAGLRTALRARSNAAPVPTKPYQVTQRPGRVSSNPRSITHRTRTRIMERDGFRCRRCGAGPNDARLVVDHVVPVAKGGTADESNLQTLCHPCNSGKSDRDPHQHDLGGAS